MTARRKIHIIRTALGPLLALAGAALVLVAGASGAAAASGPAWRLTAISNTTVAPGGTTHVLVQMENAGDVDMDASRNPMTLTASLPAGLQVTATQFVTNSVLTWTCLGFPTSSLSCSDTSDTLTAGTTAPHERGMIVLTVTASAALLPGTLKTITFAVAGGGAATKTTAVPVTVAAGLPGFGLAALDGQVTSDAAGAPATQAGGHPYAASVSFDLNTYDDPDPSLGDAWPVEPLKDAYTDLPQGLVGDPLSVGQCTTSQLANADGLSPLPLCPSDSQVGTAVIRMNGSALIGYVLGPLPVFNLAPPPNVPARFGFNVLGSVVTLDAKVRPDYGVSIAVANAPEAVPLAGTTITLWGSPGDSSHDAERACPGDPAPALGGATCPFGATPTAFLRMPTSCTAPAGSPVQDGLVTTLHVDSWVHPGRLGPDGLPDLSDPAWKTQSFTSHAPPAYPLPPSQWGAHLLPSGCDQVPFHPTLSGQPDSGSTPASPAGFSFDLSLPQPNDPAGLGEGDLKTAVVTLPAGMSVSPSSANGLTACSSTQIALGSAAEPTCPDTSKIGTVEVRTPLLPNPLDGYVYLAAQGDNPFGSLLAIYIVAHGPGFVLKLPGHVQADPVTGQLTTTFDNNPQLPFTNLHLQFDGGPHAPLVLPDRCGPYTTHATLTSWSNATVQSDSTFTVNGSASDCSAGTVFSPALDVGTANPVAGTDSTFNLRLTRTDRDQQLSGITVNMPSGLTGRIANAELCPDAQAASGACPAGSQIGSVTVGAGAGADPFYISAGRAYLTGPYKGAPFGLSIVVPAKAGPFDLGNVIVRSALLVDRHTADITVQSDPLPTILQGIPLDVRDVRVSVDKPHFFVNPTSCAPKTIYGTFTSTEGWVTHANSRFQVGWCGKLGLQPKMVLSVGAKHHTAAGSTTPLSTTLTMPRGDTNLRYVKVSLPSTLNAHLDVIDHACTRAQFESGHCSQAKAGSAVATTPLLRDPLRGNVYFVKNGHPIPDLFVALRGQVAFDLIGRVSIPGGTRLATTFNLIPDVPITKFVLRLSAGSRGTLGAAVNLCTTRARDAAAGLLYRGQNGRTLRLDQRVVIQGCPKPKRGKGARVGSGR